MPGVEWRDSGVSGAVWKKNQKRSNLVLLYRISANNTAIIPMSIISPHNSAVSSVSLSAAFFFSFDLFCFLVGWFVSCSSKAKQETVLVLLCLTVCVCVTVCDCACVRV